jgi:phosphoribosylformylglycinamidine synthase subunit PurSL
VPLYHRLETSLKAQFPDSVGHKVLLGIRSDLHLEVPHLRTCKVLALSGNFSMEQAELIGRDLLVDSVVEDLALGELNYLKILPTLTHAIQVSFLPGVTDNVSRSTKEAIQHLLNSNLDAHDTVFSATVYLLEAPNLSATEIQRIANEVLHNPVIEKIDILTRAQLDAGGHFAEFKPMDDVPTPATKTINLQGLSDEALIVLSSSMCLALTLEEMKAIQGYYQRPETLKERATMGLGNEPTDVELEALAQTWSEHCKHKIFAANVEYTDENGKVEHIESLFKTMIYKPTIEIMKKRLDISSVFSDNAGAFHFDDNWDICIKAETHNSPSALDPYGGAMTGIVGVNRDVMGTGRGFLPIFNTDIFCFGPPNYNKPLPGRLHHPRRIFRGVHRGVKDGGNESGIPTVNGSISFDDRFIGKPLVFCGTGGIAPRNLGGKPIVEKWINPGDKVIMLGGLIGKDGIHGATFSSEGLSSASPTSAVQIGDPITQKRMTDFLIVARDLQLYNFITDNGAGGLSSSLGEMAGECGGLKIDLSKAPLKYAGLAPWEIFLSEAQERMSLAVAPEKLDEFMALAKEMSVTAACLGEFVNSGRLDLFYGDEQVASLDMEFLHKGLPTLQLKAKWTPPQNPELADAELPAFNLALCQRILGRYNICSKEDWVRQYDHEVQGMSVIKPFSGIKADAPSDCAVIRPDVRTWKGLAVAHGLVPRYSDIDTYHMTCNVMDEAIRSLVAVGADPDTGLGLDNFCWPDPVATAKNPQGEYKMAQLVRSNKALRDMAMATNIPCISGKDSMKNDYVAENIRISIPPTLLYTALAVIPDVRKSVSMDFKQAGDIILLVGETKNELGGSEFYNELGVLGQNVPVVDPKKAMACYRKIHQATLKGLIASAHDCSEGGLLVTLAESCFGGRVGAQVDLPKGLHPVRQLFSESASRLLISCRPEHLNALLAELQGETVTHLGVVAEAYQLQVAGQSLDLNDLYRAWRQPLSTLE